MQLQSISGAMQHGPCHSMPSIEAIRREWDDGVVSTTGALASSALSWMPLVPSSDRDPSTQPPQPWSGNEYKEKKYSETVAEVVKRLQHCRCASSCRHVWWYLHLCICLSAFVLVTCYTLLCCVDSSTRACPICFPFDLWPASSSAWSCGAMPLEHTVLGASLVLPGW